MTHKNQVIHRTNNKPILYDLYFNPSNKPKPLVIFCHGYKGFKDWGCWDLVAERFSKEAIFFAKFNFSHNGGTIENPIDFPDLNAFAENNYSKELDDLNAVIDLLLSKDFNYYHDIDPNNVTLIGHSRGGGISIIKTSENKRITKLITWASVSDFSSRFGSTDAILNWRIAGVKYVLNGRTKQQMPHHFQFYKDFKDHEERLHIESAAKQIKVPSLIIHAKGDVAVKFSEAEALKSWSAKAMLIAIEGSNHVFGASHPWKSNVLPNQLKYVVEQSIDFIKS
ncbi:Alpha/beta hydrolase family protein [Formosa sp. Hel1_31_208]|uniref:alpha/beta hydrolase family protein n=1 Tax=Formosa sp. Hel1_31_208 TaxID=1798225 RepID=UPI00087D21DF|nr:prolyl oligopeptidase family serine peptidase [Formosa sp. Hel1_31_208]SDR71956.1 Alpha/beta hydrolase family protein [Formosa sp. Hel1_31_208]